MLKQTLEAVGLRTISDIPAEEIFSIDFTPEKYGLTESAKKKLSVLKDFVSEYNREIPVDKKTSITTSDQAAKLMYDTFRSLDHEEVWAVLLNKANIPLYKTMINEGGVDVTLFDRRKIIKLALERNATGLILYHNHPSGRPEPSMSDIKETASLQEALKVLDMTLVDHIILTDTKYYAFSDEKVTAIRRG